MRLGADQSILDFAQELQYHLTLYNNGGPDDPITEEAAIIVLQKGLEGTALASIMKDQLPNMAIPASH
jgi:hypothetical protein